jgi:hypothetical protein
MINPTITHVYFEKDGLPYNGSVHYTVNCYGHFNYPGIPLTTATPRKAIPEKEIIYSYSATCPEYGCAVYEPYYLNYRVIDSCDLEGEAGGTSFILKNFTRSPQPKNCSDLHQFDIGKGYDEYYRTTPEYEQCENASSEAAGRCNTYLDPCSPGVDTDCGNWVVDGGYVKDSQQSLSCREEAEQKRRSCDVYLEKVDPSTMVMWKNNLTGQYEPAMRICTARFTIPSENASGHADVPPSQIIHLDTKKDNGSLWCRILQFLGGRCE